MYGLDVEATILAGERDRNFLITEAGEPRCVLKVYNQMDDADTRDFQQRALLHVHRHGGGGFVPRLMPTLDGAAEFHFVAGGQEHHGTLISFMRGVSQNLVPSSRALRQDIGRSCATLDKALSSFHHAAARRELLWDIMQLASLQPMVQMVDDVRRRRWMEEFIASFVGVAVPELYACRCQIIHNDINTSNILVAEDTKDRVSGVIDFGDMVYAPLINEIGVAAGYAAKPEDDLFEVIADLMVGYEEVIPLQEVEVRQLYHAVVARLVARVLIYLWRSSMFPQNRDYILRNSEAAWTMIDEVMRISPEEGRLRVMSAWRGGA
ncbi:MAG: phosphotransferase [Rhizobiaceae bacterium]|nr:phosphotransferase [Rhizobiaceae bacterium]